MGYEHRVRDGKHLGHLVKSDKIWSGKVQLVGLSAKVKYVSSTTYVCTSHDCDGCRDNMIYVKVFSPVPNKGEAREDVGECWRCGGNLQEQFSKRNVTEVLTGLVRMGDTSSGVVKAVFRQEDADKLVLGRNLVIVFSVETVRNGDVILEVVSVEECLEKLSVSSPFSCPDIETLYKDRRESSWSFVRTLAYLLGDKVAPKGSFFQLRLALLLSLASGEDQRLNVLSIGEDDLITSRIMRECLSMSSENIIYNSNISLLGDTRIKTPIPLVTAGQLHLVQDGVLYLGNMSSIKQSVKETLVRTVETGEVRGGERLTSALWSWASTSCVRRKSGTSSSLSTLISSLQDVSSIFHIIVSSVHNDKETDLVMSEFVLNY